MNPVCPNCKLPAKPIEAKGYKFRCSNSRECGGLEFYYCDYEYQITPETLYIFFAQNGVLDATGN